MPTTKATTIILAVSKEHEEEHQEEEAAITHKNCDTPMATPTTTSESTITTTTASQESAVSVTTKTIEASQPTLLPLLASAAACHKPLLFSRRFQDKRNFSSLPLFVYATSPSTHAHSADGVGVAREAAAFSKKVSGSAANGVGRGIEDTNNVVAN